MSGPAPPAPPPSRAAASPLRVAVLASGTGSNLQAILHAIADGHVQAHVCLVLSDRPEAQALQRARAAGVPTVVALPPTPGEGRDAFDARVLAVLQQAKPELVVLAGYMRIVGPRILNAFPQRVVNIHPSLLPAFRGLDAVGQAHRAGAQQTGATTHLVTQELDGGPILLQAGLRLHPQESVEDLRRRVLRLEHVLLPRTIQLFAEGRILPQGRIAPGASWLGRNDLPLSSGAWYSEGF